jgi:hypothetical protein
MVFDLELFQQHINVVLKVFKNFLHLCRTFTWVSLSFCIKGLLNKALSPTYLLLGANNLLERNNMGNKMLSSIVVQRVHFAYYFI